MKLKNLTKYLTIGAAVTSFMAHSGDMGPVAQDNSKFIYVEGNIGYANHPWQDDRTTTVGLENQLGVLRKLSNINGGLTGGIDAGYQFTKYLALEGGWFYLPKASYNRDRTVSLPVGQTTFTLPEGLQVNINSGFGYIAAKGTIPIYNKLDAFGKLGAAYVYNNANVNVPASLVNSPIVHTSNQSNYWNALFGFGLQYNVLDRLTMNVQYDFVPGYRDASANNFITPNIQLVTFGLGYRMFL